MCVCTVQTCPGLVKLIDARFYHLDTCLQLIDDRTALFVPCAFDEASVALLERAFPRLIEVPEEDNRVAKMLT